MSKKRDRTAEIRKLEEAYAKIDQWAARRKEGIALKLARLRKEQGMV